MQRAAELLERLDFGASADRLRKSATGQLSSSSPNLQNIPIKTVEGTEIRKKFLGVDPEAGF